MRTRLHCKRSGFSMIRPRSEQLQEVGALGSTAISASRGLLRIYYLISTISLPILVIEWWHFAEASVQARASQQSRNPCCSASEVKGLLICSLSRQSQTSEILPSPPGKHFLKSTISHMNSRAALSLSTH